MQRLDGVVTHPVRPDRSVDGDCRRTNCPTIDAISGEVHQIVPRQTRVLDIEISPDSSKLFVATAQIEVWDIGSGRRVQEIEPRASATR